MREIEETLAHNLREVREKKGYTLKDVVKGTGYTEVSISRWETGTRIPKATVLYNLAKFYGVSVDRFSGGKHDKRKEKYQILVD